jgi:hypothetical protein
MKSTKIRAAGATVDAERTREWRCGSMKGAVMSAGGTGAPELRVRPERGAGKTMRTMEDERRCREKLVGLFTNCHPFHAGGKKLALTYM